MIRDEAADKNRAASRPPSAAAEPAPGSASGSWRAFLVGAVCVAVSVYFVTEAEVVLSTVRIGYLQLPPIAIAMLLLVLALKKLLPFLKLSAADVLLVYCMTLVGVMVSSHGVAQKLVPGLVSLNFFTNSFNRWHGLFDPQILPRMVAYDPRNGHPQPVALDYYNGLPRHSPVPWALWALPVFNWGVLVFLVLFAFLCLTAILRRQWVDNERLSFPLTQLPLALVEGGGRPLLRNRLTWLGILLPLVVFGIKQAHQISPQVPDIPLFFVLNDSLQFPLNAVFYTPVTISFAAVGLFYLLPADILFSLWFFFLLTRVQQLVFISYNIPTPPMPTMPTLLFTGYQTLGAYFVITGYLVWTARVHLAAVWAVVRGKENQKDKQSDAGELLPYRTAVIGLGGSLLAGTLWLCLMGMSWWLALGELLVYVFVIALVMARSTAEAGMLMTETTFRPVDLIRLVAPLHALGPANLTLLAFCDNLFTRDLRGLVLTGMLDSAKIGDAGRVPRRRLALLLSGGVFLAFFLAVALNIWFPYHEGANKMDGYLEQSSPMMFWTDYAHYMVPSGSENTPQPWQMPAGAALGVAVTLLLIVMRAAFFWWPFHPLGYALAGSWTTVVFWFPCLVAWLCKTLSLRYGGLSFFTKARPFFLGMILGEFCCAVLVVLLHMLFGTTPPAFPWA